MIAYAFPIARLCLAAVFLYSGVDKLWHWRSSIEEVKSDGLPWPTTFAGATVFTQLVGGFLVATGFWHGWAVPRRLYDSGHFARAPLLATPRKRVPACTADQPGACGDRRRAGLALPARSRAEHQRVMGIGRRADLDRPKR
jgi:hypothetical protein